MDCTHETRAADLRAKFVALTLFFGLASGSAFSQSQEQKPASRPADGDPVSQTIEEQRESDDPFARDAWRMHGRTLSHGNPAEYRLRAYEQKMAQRALRRMQQQNVGDPTLRPHALPSPSWTNLGPAPMNSDASGFGAQDYGQVSGRITAITVDQNDVTGNTVYAAAAFGGVWKTTNGTAAPGSVVWTPIMDNEATLSVGAVAVQPGNSNVVLVGTGEPNQAIDSYYGLGILRSIDGGLTWSLTQQSADSTPFPFHGFGVSKIAFSTDNPSVVVVAFNTVTNASADGGFTSLSGRGLEYSTDAGATWHLANVNDGGVAITPVQSATDIVYSPISHVFYAAIRYHGIYSSSDGINFTRLATQPGGLTTFTCPSAVSSSCPFYRGHIALHPTRKEMYVWYINSGSADQGIFESTDGGNTWTSISVGELDTGCGDGTRCGTSAQGLYDLYLSAVPEGNDTALYAGAINIYKCKVTASNPDCKSAPVGTNWLNLTHVYSCIPAGALAHVHPDQHAIDFSRANPSLIYFGNDGGVYRTLNGPGLNTGSCSGVNPFDNLNGTFGSVTQFYTLTGHPTNPTSLVGGTQDNGTPAIDSAHSGTNGVTWSSVSGGDGAFVAVDPTNGNFWYVSNTNSATIYFSQSGITSRSAQFSPPVITPNTVGGDKSDWVTPFKLDPADPTKIIIGTCRVWRGPSSGTGWTAANALTNNWGTGTTDACASTAQTAVTTIRTLAAGGPKTSNGSQVIYAGTEYGHVFATTNADAGPASWTDAAVSVIGTCNGGTYPQCGYPISGLALDPTDTSGKTVYATVMGFAVPHVLKSTDAGQTWKNISGNLPDAPADAIAIDPANPAIIYVGSDIGVFATQDGGATWSEYGTGFPNTEVVAFDIFNSGSSHLLRAATHGRGVWSTTLASAAPPPSGVLALSPGFLTFLNQSVGTSATQTITVTASGAPVTIASMVPPDPPFVLGLNGCLPPLGSPSITLQPGSSCQVAVKYSPTAAGVQTSSLSFTSNGIGSPQIISLTGNGVVATGTNITPETGWWWDGPHGAGGVGLSGTGFFIEYHPSSGSSPAGLFIGGFLYDANGKSQWLVASAAANGILASSASGLTYNGKWLKCSNGQSLTGTWKQNNGCPQDQAVTFTFTDSTHATLTRPDGTLVPLTRFVFTGATTTVSPQPGSPQSGWWWIDPSNPTYNPGSGGTGYGIEIQGNAAFIVAYVYDPTTGNPIWYLTTSGATPMPSPTTYNGTWNVFAGLPSGAGGPQWTSPEKPQCTATVATNCWGATSDNSYAGVGVSLNFTDATHGTMTMGNVTIPIVKFTSF